MLVEKFGKNMLWTEEVASQIWALLVPPSVHMDKASGCLWKRLI